MHVLNLSVKRNITFKVVTKVKKPILLGLYMDQSDSQEIENGKWVKKPQLKQQ